MAEQSTSAPASLRLDITPLGLRKKEPSTDPDLRIYLLGGTFYDNRDLAYSFVTGEPETWPDPYENGELPSNWVFNGFWFFNTWDYLHSGVRSNLPDLVRELVKWQSYEKCETYAYVLVYNEHQRDTFDFLAKLYDEALKQPSDLTFPLCAKAQGLWVIANNAGTPDVISRVRRREGEAFAAEIGASFLECSSATGEGCKDFRDKLVKTVYFNKIAPLGEEEPDPQPMDDKAEEERSAPVEKPGKTLNRLKSILKRARRPGQRT